MDELQGFIAREVVMGDEFVQIKVPVLNEMTRAGDTRDPLAEVGLEHPVLAV
jgi:hypothetical protein